MFSSAWLLCILCCSTLLLFGDRGVISCNSVEGDAKSGIQGDFSLSLTQNGWIYASLMVGLSISAPTAAQLSKRWNALRLIGVGLALASIGAAGTGLSPTFSLLLLSRCLIGIGCGPFISLASPLIDDSAPREHKSSYLATLFLCIPVGFAAGYIWAAPIAGMYGWRAPFLIEASLLAPFALLLMLAPNPNDIRRAKPSGFDVDGSSNATRNTSSHISADLRALARRPVVVISMLGLAQLNGSLGGLSFFGPKAAKYLLNLDPATADLLIGVVTVVTGALGTLGGGLALDKMGPSVRSALLVCTAGLTVSAVFTAVSFILPMGFWAFAGAFAVSEFAMFATAAPANAVLLWSVPPALRPAALAVAEVGNHVLGDVPLPPLLGLLQERVGNWRITMGACAGVLGVAAGLFGLAICAHQGCSGDSVLQNERDNDERHLSSGSIEEPLLADETAPMGLSSHPISSPSDI